jgi:hypothetical protein
MHNAEIAGGESLWIGVAGGGTDAHANFLQGRLPSSPFSVKRVLMRTMPLHVGATGREVREEGQLAPTHVVS